ncbi:hypothetical protein DPM33_30160 [Mesorhizobium hawassense]|uniref:Uncharacterized protein n=1 Tax=Mesorhizobium hawassense TaxID=1209954 RepID=A0A330H8P7_9HYPH|nr:hypothetical protein [Mesorhizobium hawassense]RAZ84720.1 hypothetical protein DPM33_30160 [Mesorhizobium hawassense]
MYNFRISLDSQGVNRSNPAGWSHDEVDAGREGGMLRDRPVFIGVTSGGVFTGDRANPPDFLTPYLSLAFSSIG